MRATRRAEIATVPALLQELKSSGIACELLFLTARDDELLRRFAETRRKHPLSRGSESLREAIALERALLEPIAQASDLIIDTSRTGVHELRELVRRRVEPRAARAACRSCSSPSASSTASPAMRTSCSTRARCRIRTGSRNCAA